MAKCNQLTALPFKGLTDKLALTGERSCTYSACHCTARVASAYSLTVWCLSFIWCGSYRFRRLNVYRLFAVINVQTCNIIVQWLQNSIQSMSATQLYPLHTHSSDAVCFSINQCIYDNSHTHTYVYTVSQKNCANLFLSEIRQIYTLTQIWAIQY